MTEKLLDLTAVEEDRRPVKIDDGPPCYMASPDTLGPRDFARVAAAGRRAEAADPDRFDDEAAEQIEQAMTDAACIVLPDEPRNRIAAVPYMRRARLVEAFISGLDKQPPTSSPTVNGPTPGTPQTLGG